MSKNALALVDCNTRDVLFQYIIETFDRKASKNEMVSPYDDQLIGKMNFRYGGMEHSMFFTYARSNEYPGKRFRNRKILYLSLGVNDISSDIFSQICATFGGFVINNDDLDEEWQKIERVKVENDPWQAAMEEANKKEKEVLDIRPELRQMLRMDAEEEEEIPVREGKETREKEGRDKETRRKEHHRPDKRRNGNGDKADKGEMKAESRGGQKHEAKERSNMEKGDKAERREELKEKQKENPKEYPRDHQKESQKESQKDSQKEEKPEASKDGQKEHPQRRPRHHRGHRPRGTKKDGQKPDQKPEGKQGEAKSGNRQEKPASAE